MANFPATPGAPHANREVRQYTLQAAQTFLLGAAVVADGSQNIGECGANPASILGFAAEPAGLDPEGGPSSTKILVYIATELAKFWISCVNAAAYTDTNTQIGLTKGSDGIWQADQTKTGVNARVYVHQADVTRNLLLVSVLAANRQVAP